jgi:Tol biopolymer transport system component
MRIRFIIFNCFLVAIVVFPGCRSSQKVGPQYKNVSRTKLKAVEDKDGEKSLVAVEEMTLAFEEVIERSPNVSAVTQITRLQGTKSPGRLDVSPDGSSIIFEAFERHRGLKSPKSNLWRASTSGTGGVSQITAGNYYDMTPNYSSDGRRVYFSSNRNSLMPRIWSVRSTGAGGISMLTQSSSFDHYPSSSVTGIVYFSSLPPHATAPQIWSIRSNGGHLTQLTEGVNPAISSDGKYLLYQTEDSDTAKFTLWRMTSDGLSPTQMTSPAEGNSVTASWSPDGQWIVFSSDRAKDNNGTQNFDIWIMAADGSNKIQLTTNGSFDGSPVFGPDGQSVYFISNRGFNWEIWKMDISSAIEDEDTQNAPIRTISLQ